MGERQRGGVSDVRHAVRAVERGVMSKRTKEIVLMYLGLAILFVSLWLLIGRPILAARGF